MDTKKLRQKILDLAIHGKLVSQDPNDEPASVLLERIRAEKERLIVEGKIKRSKKSATSDTYHYENVPFDVPEGWCWCSISDICSKIGSGSTPRGSNYAEHGIPFFRSQNVYNDGLVYDDIKYISEDVHKSMIGTEVLPKDLLLNITGGSLGRCAVVPSDFERGNVSQHVCILRTVQVLPEYLHCFIISDYFSDTMILSGSGREGLPKYSLEAMMIPIPPLAEQSRIVSSIVQLITFVNSIEGSITDILQSVQVAKSKILALAIRGKLVPQDANDEPASELLKRINPKAVTSCDNPHYENVPFEIPSSWAWCKVRDVADVARGGSPRPIKQYLTDSPDGVNWIKIGDAEEGSKYITKTAERIIPEGAKRSRYVKTGDFLLTNSMSFGKPYILGTDGCIHDGWLVISPTDGAYDKNFLYYLLSSSFAYNQFSEKAGGAVVSNLNKDKVSDSLFPLPPIAEQKRIADMIEKLYKNLEIIASTLL